jgi:hypothetical protein
MATYLSVSAPDSPATTEYLSFPEEDSDHEQALRPAVLKSTSATTLRTESPSTRALLCINATRILLLETQSMGYMSSLEPLRRERVLHVRAYMRMMSNRTHIVTGHYFDRFIVV